MSETPKSEDQIQALTEIPDISSLPAETDMMAVQNKQTCEQQVISMEALHSVPVTITAVLGQRKIDVATLIGMKAGEIVEIDRKVGEAIDLYVNETLVARGELVMVDDGLGVTMTEIIEPDCGADPSENPSCKGVA